MNILGIDTSGRDGSVALACGDADSFEVLEYRTLAGGMYSAELVPRIAEMLSARGLGNKDIDLFAVCSGPGSFTGLRVGLSAAKALAEVLRKPIVATTVLEAICMSAISIAGNSSIISVLDAQRGEVYCGEYAITGTSVGRVAESLSSFNNFIVWLSAQTNIPTVCSPDRTLLDKLIAAGTTAHEVARPGADTYARIGLQKFLAGQSVSPDELDADYIRRSDAEIFSVPKK